MSAKYALIIGNTEYKDPGLAKLSAPGKDAQAFARLLKSPDLCAFDQVDVLLNEQESVIREGIDTLFNEKKPDDLLLLYFSGHGVRDEYGSLYLAVRNTNRARLHSTAIESDFIRKSMDQSRSRRQVLILDCCNSGAFGQGSKAATGMSIGTAVAFEGTGYGRVVLTASDSTQLAWEGDKILGQTANSLFTHFLIKGLEGAADQDSDGRITVDELYDYAFAEIVNVTPKQTPGKWTYKQQGDIILRHNIPTDKIQPVQLPDDLIEEAQDMRPYVREAAVQKLAKILQGRNIGLARSAQELLEQVAADENTTRRVALTATQALESFRASQAKAAQTPVLVAAAHPERALRLPSFHLPKALRWGISPRSRQLLFYCLISALACGILNATQCVTTSSHSSAFGWPSFNCHIGAVIGAGFEGRTGWIIWLHWVNWLPGLLFGLLVALAGKYGHLRIPIYTIVSGLCYLAAGMVNAAIWNGATDISLPVGGLLAGLVGAAGLAIGRKLVLNVAFTILAVLRTALIGAALGIAFVYLGYYGFLLLGDRGLHWTIWSVAFLFWQYPVALSLSHVRAPQPQVVAPSST